VSDPVRKSGFVVAIDGPAGAGKSTLARGLAESEGLPYVNTGVMYRAVAREALRKAVDVRDAAALADVARRLRFRLDEGDPPSLLVDGMPPADDLVTPEVEAVVSEVARHPEVRTVLRAVQRRVGAAGAVVEGRDIGKVVFPDADVKVFLRADPAERAARRQAERGDEDPELAEALDRRDRLDEVTNPFVPAPDAMAVDTTGRRAVEVMDEVRALVRSARGPGRV
jgi:cytidylate kinase